MKTSEKPILFNPHMVRAILDGHQTAMIRPMKPQPELDHDNCWLWEGFWWSGNAQAPNCVLEKAPWRVGDLLWIQEAWRAWHGLDEEKPSGFCPGEDIWYESNKDRAPDRFGKLRPGIYLPKLFARPERLKILKVEVGLPQNAWRWRYAFELVRP